MVIKRHCQPGVDPENAGSGRDIHLDILKVLGLLCIILAHSGPPSAIMDLRCFDVPLMVIAAGAAFYHSSRNRGWGAWEYVEQRALRLIGPAWAFLLFHFAATAALFAAAHKPYPFTPAQMYFSFALTLRSGIGYVWIIRVFVLVSVLAPLFLALSRRLKEGAFLAVLLALYAGYEAARFLTAGIGGPVADLFLEPVLWYLLPYGCLFGLGVRLPVLSTRSLLFVLAAAVAAFLGSLWSGQATFGLPLAIERHKYPPGLGYVAYGVAASLLLYLAVRGRTVAEGPLRSWIVNISSSSLWIYLWHIFFLLIWGLASFKLPAPARHYLVTFAVVTVLSVTAASVQKRAVKQLLDSSGLQKKNRDRLIVFLR